MSSGFEFGDWIFLLTSVFEMLFFCGFQTGWSSLVYVLVEEEIYSHLCDEASSSVGTNVSVHALPGNGTMNNCPAQQEMLNLAYTLSSSVSSMAAFPIGIAIDTIGPRIIRIISGWVFFFLHLSSVLCIAALYQSIPCPLYHVCSRPHRCSQLSNEDKKKMVYWLLGMSFIVLKENFVSFASIIN